MRREHKSYVLDPKEVEALACNSRRKSRVSWDKLKIEFSLLLLITSHSRHLHMASSLSEPSSVSPSATSTISAAEYDKSLYSRQVYVVGEDGMRRLGASHVFLSGCSGLGAEIGIDFALHAWLLHLTTSSCPVIVLPGKNLVLSGVASLTIHDDTLCSYNDLSSQFFLQESDVVQGRTRAAASLAKLQELNPAVSVRQLSEPLTDELLSSFTVCMIGPKQN